MLAEDRPPGAGGAAGSMACLLRQLLAAFSFELAALSPRSMDLADRIAATQGDDGRNERQHERADRRDDLQHDDHGDDGRDDGDNCFHATDYRHSAFT